MSEDSFTYSVAVSSVPTVQFQHLRLTSIFTRTIDMTLEKGTGIWIIATAPDYVVWHHTSGSL